MRLFAAIPVPDMIKDYAWEIKNKLHVGLYDIKWVEYENYHLTLKFLGEVQDSEVQAIKDRLQMAAEASPPFDLFFSGLGFFPHRNRPRVIWLGAKGEIAKADFLGERIDTYLQEIGFDEEKKRSFHLTLGRIRSEKNQSQLLQQVGRMNDISPTMPVQINEFYLMESQLFSGGPKYIIQEKYELEG
ncbi:MAG: RNA 2',3'-cyclic phosphodiesterase [Deltaproteobacteria bacterium]